MNPAADHVAVPRNALLWLTSKYVGLSSRAIFVHMTGGNSVASNDRPWARQWPHPLDPSDLARCIRLLEWVPDWSHRITEMGDRSPEWAALVSRWDDLVSLLDAEAPDWRTKPDWRAPRCYALMRQLRNP